MAITTKKPDGVKKLDFRINNLVIIGGPTAAGKSTLTSKIQQDCLPDLSNLLGINQTSNPIYTDAEKLERYARKQNIEQLILHYDFLHQLLPGPDYRHLSEVISSSDRIAALTLCIPSKLLVARLASRISSTCASLLKRPRLFFLRRIRTLWNKKQYLEKDSNAITLYKDWFAYLEKKKISNLLISGNIDLDTDTCIPYDWNAAKIMLDNETI
jgi:adenylate kinase family enzyme